MRLQVEAVTSKDKFAIFDILARYRRQGVSASADIACSKASHMHLHLHETFLERNSCCYAYIVWWQFDTDPGTDEP